MNLFQFLKEINSLKKEKRSGWIAENINNPESVADHSFGVSIMTLVLGSTRKGIDLDKALKMAVVHDIAESIIGDILVDWKVELFNSLGKSIKGRRHGITKEEKHEMEKDAMLSLTKEISNGKEIFDLWTEFEDNNTPESRFVRDIDRMEMLIQASVYAKEQGKDMKHWFQGERNAIEDPELKEIFNKILENGNIVKGR